MAAFRTLTGSLRALRHALPRQHPFAPQLARSYAARPPTYVRFAQAGGQQIKGRGVNTKYIIVGGGGVLGTYYVLHLEKTATGRWRFIDVSETTDRELGEQAAQEIYKQYGRQMLPDNHPEARRVQRVAKRLLDASGLLGNSSEANEFTKWGAQGRKSEVKWTVKVIQSDEKNAFVLPNGLICVFTGLLPICRTEDALAAVMGHEISHQIARHSAERLSGTSLLAWAGLILDFANIDPGLSRIGLHYLMSLPNSRAAEAEADHIGLWLSAKACYDPREAVGLWERMSKADQVGSPPAFMSTHPSHANRIKEWIPEAMERRPESCGALGGYAAEFRRAFS